MSISRRDFLGRAAAAGAGAAGIAAFSGCGAPSIAAQKRTGGGDCSSSTGKLASTLRFSNWPLYIDFDDKTKHRPSLDLFTKKTGVKVEYVEDINDNETFSGKNSPILQTGQGIGRDLVVLTDYMAAQWVRNNYVQEVDLSVMPNVVNLQPNLANPRWDPLRRHSLPWQSGMTGIAYNPSKVDFEVTKLQDLLNPKLSKHMTMLSSMSDTLCLVMQSIGLDPTKIDNAMFAKGMTEFAKYVPHARAFTGNEYADGLARGDIWACVAWSGDVVQLQADHPGLKFVVPDAGAVLWTDNMMIPLGGDVFTASTYMNFVYEPPVAAMIEDYVNYFCPNTEAQSALEKIDPNVAKNPLIFPDKSILAKLKSFDSDAANNPTYKSQWNNAIGL